MTIVALLSSCSYHIHLHHKTKMLSCSSQFVDLPTQFSQEFTRVVSKVSSVKVRRATKR
jgi:hypothetical protein